MPLRLLPLKVSDFAAIVGHASEPDYVPGDDLVAPPNPVAWPVSTREEGQARLEVCMAMQEQRFRQDPTCNFLKVVDLPASADSDGSAASDKDLDAAPIVAVCRWHRYPTGYSYADEAHWEPAALLSTPASALASFPPNFNVPMHDFILSSRDEFRPSWMPAEQPAWLLMHLVTRPSARGRGAARLLIEWGLEQARREQIPAYLEAGKQGEPIYRRFGFKQVGELRSLDLQPYGMSQKFEMANMVWRYDQEA